MEIFVNWNVITCIWCLTIIRECRNEVIMDATPSSMTSGRTVDTSCAHIPAIYTNDNSTEHSECNYPYLWSVEQNNCANFSQVDCGDRIEPITPCQYANTNCTKPQGEHVAICTCQEYKDLNYETCSNLSNGVYVWKARRWSGFYIECFKKRTIPRRCPDGKIFDFIKDECKNKADFVNEAYHSSLYSEIPQSYRYLIHQPSSTTSASYGNVYSIHLTPSSTFSETAFKSTISPATSIRSYNSFDKVTFSKSSSENGPNYSEITILSSFNHSRSSSNEYAVVYSTLTSVSSIPYSMFLTKLPIYETVVSNIIGEHRHTISEETSLYTSLETHLASTIKTSVPTSSIKLISSIQPSSVIRNSHLNSETTQTKLNDSTVDSKISNSQDITLSQDISQRSTTKTLDAEYYSTSNSLGNPLISLHSANLTGGQSSLETISRSIQTSNAYFSSKLTDSVTSSFLYNSSLSTTSPYSYKMSISDQREFQISSGQNNGKNIQSSVFQTSSSEIKQSHTVSELSSVDDNHMFSEFKSARSTLTISGSTLSPFSSPISSETTNISDQLFLTLTTLTSSFASTLEHSSKSFSKMNVLSTSTLELPVSLKTSRLTELLSTMYPLSPTTISKPPLSLSSSKLVEFKSIVSEPPLSQTQTVHLSSPNTTSSLLSSNSRSNTSPTTTNIMISSSEPFTSSTTTSSFAPSSSLSSSYLLSTKTSSSLLTTETYDTSVISSSLPESLRWTPKMSSPNIKLLSETSLSVSLLTLPFSGLSLSNSLPSVSVSITQPVSSSISSSLLPKSAETSIVTESLSSSPLIPSDSSFDVAIPSTSLHTSKLSLSSSSSILSSTTQSLPLQSLLSPSSVLSLTPTILSSTVQLSSSLLSSLALSSSSLSTSLLSSNSQSYISTSIVPSTSSSLLPSPSLPSSSPSLSSPSSSSLSSSSPSLSSSPSPSLSSSSLLSPPPSSLSSSPPSPSLSSSSSPPSSPSSETFSTILIPTSSISSNVLSSTSGIISIPSTKTSEQSYIRPTRTLSTVQSSNSLEISTLMFSSSMEMISSSVSISDSDRATGRQSESNTSLIVGLSVGLTVTLVLIVLSVYIVRRRRIKMNTKSGVRLPPELYISENL